MQDSIELCLAVRLGLSHGGAWSRERELEHASACPDNPNFGTMRKLRHKPYRQFKPYRWNNPKAIPDGSPGASDTVLTVVCEFAD
jgi:hypothetical protein